MPCLKAVTLAMLGMLAVVLTGCLSTGLSEVEAEDGFDWNALKRDQILMTPLMDLRKDQVAPATAKDQLTFFTDAQRLAYPEAFKQVFFKLRKDIRVFGAGGAYENVSALPNLKAMTENVMSKTPLADADVAAIRAGHQDIRFVFFFAMVEERLDHDFQYTFRSDQVLDVKTYSSTRMMNVRLALWDSKTNKTVWRGTQRLTPTDTHRIEVRNPTKRPKKDGNRIYFVGVPERTSLADELQRNRGAFPDFPGREPSFSASFDDFALALPLDPSEAKLIEYTHFTYHRPEFGVRTAALGNSVVPSLQFGLSSAINYNLRFGGAFLAQIAEATTKIDGEEFELSSSAYGATFDYEWVLSKSVRLLTGTMAGAAVFVADHNLDMDTDAGEAPMSISDGALFLWPRVFLLFGDKGGLQAGAGVAARFFDGIEEPVFKANRPSPWSIDLAIAYAFRGF